jgi:putative peptide zinc metalloprotease protein
MLRLADEVRWRASKRGLVLCTGDGDTSLLEHARAAELPDLVTQAHDVGELGALLGGDTGAALASDLLALGIVVDDGAEAPAVAAEAPRRFRLSRTGLEVHGIDVPARVVAQRVLPVLRHPLSLVVLLGVVGVGWWLLLVVGRPEGPAVTASPLVDALLGLTIATVLSVLHEFGHAVALAHFGRRTHGAGVGWYWGMLSFYVDSSEGLTLPRRQRIVQAMAGIMVDIVTVALLAIAAHVTSSPLVLAVAWRLAVLGVLEIVVNGLPLLEVDGHWALADALDEPDLAARSRRALGRALRGRPQPVGTPRWFVGYGAASLLGGLGLLVLTAWVFAGAAGELVLALLGGGLVEVAAGVLILLPVVVALLLSGLGLLLEVLASPDAPASGGVSAVSAIPSTLETQAPSGHREELS